MKIMLMGYGRHGKDTIAESLSTNYNLKVANSSWFVAEKAVFPELSTKYGYKTVQACFDDRHNHRQEWFELIRDFNTPDNARMSRDIFKENDVYVGIRNIEEFIAAKEENLFDISIWVDARQRLPAEDKSSCTVTLDVCDYILDNNHSKYFAEIHLQKIIEHATNNR